MARLAQSQANYCAKVGRLIHSNRFAFQGGENLAEGGRNFPPRAIVNSWLKSNAGHREYLLHPRVRKAGIGISKSKGKTYVAWAFSDKPPTYPDCPYYKPHRHRPKTRGRGSGWVLTLKLFLGLLVIAGFVDIIHRGYILFTHQTSLVMGAILFLAEVGFWIWLVTVLRRPKYRHSKPSFKLTFVSVLAIVLVCAFAGIEPLSTYKDNVLNKITTTLNSNTSTPNNTQGILVPTIPSTTSEDTTTIPKSEDTQTGIKEDVAPTENNPPIIASYETIFNNYRVQHGLRPLVFTSELNNLAQKRAMEIQTNFSHEGIMKYNLGENIVMGISSDQEALDIWDKSPGHKANMLDPQYTKTGYCRNGGYAVQLFSW